MTGPLLSPLDALRLMCEHYPHGGRPAVAQRLGMSDEHLRKQLAGATSHKMGVIDANLIASMCAQARCPHAAAYATSVAACSGVQVYLHVDDAHDPVHAQPQRHVGDVIRESAQVAEAAISALADGEVTSTERRHISRQVAEAIAALQKLQAAVVAANLRSEARAPRNGGRA